MVEEALAAGGAEHLGEARLSTVTDGVEQLVTHLVTALTELHGYYGHCCVGKSNACGSDNSANSESGRTDGGLPSSSAPTCLVESDGKRKSGEAFPLCARLQNKAKEKQLLTRDGINI